MDNLSRIDTTKIYPKFLKLLKECLDSLNKQDIIYIVTSGYRSVDEQSRLYRQGRTDPGPVVTFADGGHSFHNFGLAVDCALDLNNTKAGLQPGYSNINMKPLVDLSKTIGIRWGGLFPKPDSPHFELDIFKHGLKLSDLLTIYNKNKKLQDVWDVLDQKVK